MVGTRARAAAVLAVQLIAFMAQLALPLVAHALNVTNPLETSVEIATEIADTLDKLAKATLAIAAALAVPHFLFGKGPSWFGKAAAAAALWSLVLWVIAKFIGG